MMTESSDKLLKKQALDLVAEMESAKSEKEITGATGKIMTLGTQIATIVGPLLPEIMKVFTG